MAGIPSEFIDQLLDRIDIIDVISPRINLKKAGKDYQALCPFHTENTPSFTVSPVKQFYHCFGCGKHGTAIGFLMEYEGMEFVDAIESLAQSAGLTVPHQGNYKIDNNKNLYEITERANRFFTHCLNQSQKAQNYLKLRGLSPDTLQTFQIGYAPESWDGLIRQYPPNIMPELDKAGLTSRNDNGKVYDKFRNRIIFPISDKRGRIIAFGGRAIDKDQKPKYLNSPETPLFHKGEELYGLNIARKFGNSKQIIVVEGYMDVIALHQAGIKNSVATLGTATSSKHVTTLLRLYDEIVFCFDGDTAGRDAAWKALQVSLPLYRDDKSIRFLFLPDAQDPDSYVNQFGTDAFYKELDHAMSFSAFLLDNLTHNIDLASIDGRARFLEKSKPYVNQLAKGQFKKLLLEEISSIGKSSMDISNQSESKIKPVNQWNPVRKAIAILLHSPHLVDIIPENMNLNQLKQNGAKILTEIVDFCRLNPHITTANIIESFRQHEAIEHLGNLVAVPLDLNEEELVFELQDITAHFNRAIQKQEIEKLRQKQSEQGLTPEEKQHLVQLLTQQIN